MSDYHTNAPVGGPPLTAIGFAWFLKRTILAIAILGISIGTVAWLTHASIDTTSEAIASESTR